MEHVLGVDGQAADLGAVHLQRAGDVACLLVVAVQRQGDEVGGGELDGVPFQHDACLGCVAAAEDWAGGFVGTERGKDLVLQGAEGALGCDFGGRVPADGDVDYGAGGDVWGEEDGREFDLGKLLARLASFSLLKRQR